MNRGAAAAVLALIAGASRADAGIEECDARVVAEPEGLAGYLCYYQYARRTGDEAGARARLEGVLAEHPDRTAARLYLARLVSMRDSAGAVEPLVACAEEFAREGHVEGEAWSREFLAESLTRLSRLEEADREAARAAELAAPAGGQLAVVIAIQRARIARLSGDEARAWGALRAVELTAGFESVDPALRCRMWDVSAGVARALGWTELSSAYARRMGELAVDPALEQCRLLAQTNLARSARRLAEDGRIPREEARETIGRAVEIVRGTAAGRDETAWWELAYDEAMLLDDEAAIVRWTELARGQSPWSRKLALAELGRRIFESDPRRYAEAEAILEEALAAAIETGHAPYVTTGLVDLARLRLAGGERAAAIDSANAALDAVERLQDLQSGERIGALRVAGFSSLYYALMGVLAGEEGDVEGAFAVSERMRARVLVEHLARALGSEAAETNDGARRTEVLREISRLQLRLIAGAAGERDELLRELERLEEEESALRGRSSGRDRLPSSRGLPVAVDEIRREIASDEAVLSFLLAPRGSSWSRVLVLTSTELRTYPLPDAETVADAVRLWLRVLARGDRTDAVGAARLYRDLVGPALAELGPGIARLVVVPDGALHRVPFDALREHAEAPSLAERFEITVVPSATVWLRLRQLARADDRGDALLMADPETPLSSEGIEELRATWSLGEPLGRLPSARAEVRRARRALGRRAEMRVGAAASEAYLRSTDLRRFGLVHLAAHAVVDEDEPGRSAILLAPGDADHDGLLQPREVIDLDFAGGAVTLSACHSAGGELLPGEGVMGLARAFFEARAATVVGSLWPVRDRETADLMDAFYRELSRGRTVGAALAAAKRERIRAGAPASAWAGFVTLGAGSQAPWPEAVESRPPSFVVVLALALAALAALAGLRALSRRG